MEISILELYTVGLSRVFAFETIAFLLLGLVVGILIGALPGLTATLGLAVVTPLTFGMGPSESFAILLGIYCGGVYGGSITAIVAKIPGTPSAMMTTLDGYPMGQRGEAGKAIGIATVSSCIGGILSVLILSLTASTLASYALVFSAQEYFAIAIFGLCIIAYISEGEIIKGLISGVLGLLFATIGNDPLTGYQRFTFGKLMLMEGIQLIPLLVGIFGFTEVLNLINRKNEEIQITQKIGKILPTWKEVRSLLPTILRGSIIGTFVGAVPAAGGTIASIIGYGIEKRVSKKSDQFGTGIAEGIAAPESANNAVTGGAMIPMLTLGIPGDAGSAILIGALLIHGLQPGPTLFSENMPVVSSIYILMALANLFFLFIGVLGARLITRVINAPMSILTPVILLLCIVGAYAARYATFDILVLLLFGMIGFIFTKLSIPVAPLVLGFVLGNLVENGLRRGMMLSKGDIGVFLNRPLMIIFLSLSMLMLALPTVIRLWKKVVHLIKKMIK